jgi:hypothetical protein
VIQPHQVPTHYQTSIFFRRIITLVVDLKFKQCWAVELKSLLVLMLSLPISDIRYNFHYKHVNTTQEYVFFSHLNLNMYIRQLIHLHLKLYYLAWHQRIRGASGSWAPILETHPWKRRHACSSILTFKLLHSGCFLTPAPSIRRLTTPTSFHVDAHPTSASSSLSPGSLHPRAQ